MSGATPPVVDFATHFYSPMPDSQRDFLAGIEAYDGSPIATDVDALLARLDDAGVDRAVLSQPVFMGAGDVEAVSAANDSLLELIDDHDRFYGLAAIPSAAGGAAAAEEFERAIEAGYHGGALPTNAEGVEVVDDELEPLLEVADDTGAPIMVHPKLHESLGPDVLDDRWQLNAVFGREIAIAESLSKVIHRGVYDRHSDLTLVFHHNGGNIGAYLRRIQGALGRAHRGDGDEHTKPFEEFRQIFESRVYMDTAGYYGDHHQYQRTLEALPASNLLYATDFPFETLSAEKFREIQTSIELVRGGAERDAILGGNALDIMVNV